MCSRPSSPQTNSDQFSPSGIKFEPCMIKLELNAYLEGRNKQAASKRRERAPAPILGRTTSRPPLKENLMCGPRCC